MVFIPEYKRDKSADEKILLRGLGQMPFPVGKNLLSDFLFGENGNSSIEKNKLFEFTSFGSMNHLKKEEIYDLIQKLSDEGFIDSSLSVFNNGSKVLSLSEKGKMKIYGRDVKKDIPKNETIITDDEMKSFEMLDNFLSGLNDEQKKAIVSPRKKILCIAGAGSGKTLVLTKRVEFLVKMKRVKSEKILAITFTRKAKEEMEKRLKTSGVSVVIETFNSFCEKILLRNTAKIYGRKMKVANKEDKMIAMLRALDEINITLEEAIKLYFPDSGKSEKNIYELQNTFMSDLFEIFEKFKISNLTIQDFGKRFFKNMENDRLEKMIYEIIKFLGSYMTLTGLRTYADQVNDAVIFLSMHPKSIPQFEHILVDEYQDVNEKQNELLRILNPANFFCVGDPRQSIFGWRGSKVDYIMNFKENNPDSEVIYLRKNYRSSRNIISLMNLTSIEMGFPGIEATIDGGEKIELLSFGSEKEEFEFVKDCISESDLKRKEIFVLARTNKELQELSSLLKKFGIKHILRNENRNEIEAKEDEVTLSTIHSIKGLEAAIVFVIGCTPANFPSRYSEHPLIEKIKIYDYNEKEEEKRLFYVAISRAKNHLYLTYSGKKHTYFITDEMKKLME